MGGRCGREVPHHEAPPVTVHRDRDQRRGKVVAGFAAFKHHLAYLPHSGSVFEEMAEDLTAYTYSKGSLRFPVDEPLPQNVVNRLIEIRLHQAGP